MPKFEEFLEAFSYNPETFNADQFKAAIKNAHDADIEPYTAAVAQRDVDLGAAQERITKLGADNWTLLMKQGPPVDSITPPGTPTPDPDPEPKSIDSFFTKEERK